MEKGLSSGQRTETVWKVVAGIVQLVVAEMVGIAPAVVALVQGCQ